MADIMQFLRNLRRPGCRSAGLVAVEFRADGIAIAAAQGTGADASLTFCDFLPRLKSNRKQTELSTLVDAAGLVGNRTSLVLSPGQYRMDLIEAPDVPPEELREAVRWRIAGMIDYPVEEAVLDVFLMPEDGLRGGPQTAYVVVARRSVIQPLLDALREAELEPVHIDIRELALRNLVERYCESPRAGALLSLRSGSEGDLTIVREGNLYLHRSVNFSLDSMDRDAATRDAALEELVVEIQRSLDYFEVQLRQAAVSRLAIVPIPDHMDTLMEKLTSTIGAEVFPLQADSLARSERRLSSVKNQHCVAAIGGALRSREAPLASAG